MDFAAKMSCIFGSTYICEQIFSAMKINISKTLSCITHEHLHVLQVNYIKLEPDIDVFCQQQQINTFKNILCKCKPIFCILYMYFFIRSYIKLSQLLSIKYRHRINTFKKKQYLIAFPLLKF